MNVQRILDIISSNKLSKIDIASKMKVSRTTLDNLLNGADVKISTVESLADVLGVSASEFFESSSKPVCIQRDEAGSLNLLELEKENIALKAENKVLREIQGLPAKRMVNVG